MHFILHLVELPYFAVLPFFTPQIPAFFTHSYQHDSAKRPVNTPPTSPPRKQGETSLISR
jgi:hypothetical protein